MKLKLQKLNDLDAFTGHYKSDQVCLDALTEWRWGCDIICPYCGKHHCKKGYGGRYVCPVCKNKFSATVGTIFHGSKVGMRKWFIAMCLISCHKKGISSLQLSRDISVTQKTAWYMLHKIRTLFAQESKIFEGEVEVDEVYLGGKEYLKHKCKKVAGTQGRSTKTKTPVFGIMQRGVISTVYAVKVPQTDRATILPIINNRVLKNSHLFSDESATYYPLSGMGYDHYIVNHKKGQYVNGKVYTNTIEGFWGHLRRMVVGIYHKTSPEHLQAYIDEAVWRYNNRRKTQDQRFCIMLGRSLHKVTYQMI